MNTEEAVAEAIQLHRDDLWLASFEGLVRSQKPATEPWQPVTDYSFEARKQVEGRHPELIRDVFKPQRVLDYGCGPGHLVALLRELGVNAEGYEPNHKWRERAAAWARPHVFTEFWACRPTPLIICREVLEHLTIRQIHETIPRLCRLTQQFCYVTTRFAKAPQHLLDVDTADDLDPSHITMLNQNLLRLLFVLEGFRRRADLEDKLDWQKKGRCLVYERV